MEKSGFSFVEEEPQVQPQESFPQKALRNVARMGTRAAETALGLPGDIAQTATNILNVGQKGSNWLRNKVGLPTEEEFVRPAWIPTSEEIREHGTSKVEKALPKNYLQPQRPLEKFGDEFISDLTSLATPLPGLGKMPFKRSLVASGLGNLASWAAENVGASEGTKSTLKIGTMLATTMAGRGKLNKTKNELYSRAESAITKDIKIHNRLEPVFKKWKLAAEKGSGDAASKKFIKSRLADISANTSDNKIGINNILELKKDWNEIKYSSEVPKRAQNAFNEMMNSLHGMIDEYGKKNPSFYKPWKTAEDIHQGLTKASGINKWMQKYVTPMRIGSTAAGLLLGSSIGLPHIVGAASSTLLAGTVGAKYGIRGFEALKNSSAIRKYYADTIKSAASKNVAAFTKNAQKLDKAVEKYDESNKPRKGFSFVD